MEYQGQTFKVIELEDKYVDHSAEYPYVQSCHENKYVVFTLRTKKTYKYQPVLLIDCQEKEKLFLPLIVGRSIEGLDDCEVLKGEFHEDGGWICKYKFRQPGLLHYQLVFVDYGGIIIRDLGSFDCILQVQSKIQLRKLRKLTVFPRCIGTIKDWDTFLRSQIELGYNAFHFAPIQQTGLSKSYYSLYDQLILSQDIFSGDNKQRYEQLAEILTKYQKQGIIFFIDIVLNHTSFDSDWIKEDQNNVFTVSNTPLLKSAFELDQTLRDWGEEIKTHFGDLEMDDDQFQQIKQSLTQLVCGLNLNQFFEVSQSLAVEFINSVEPREPSQNIFSKDPSQLVFQFIQNHCVGLGEERKGVSIKSLGQKWKSLNYAYQPNDVYVGIRKFNKKWKDRIKNQWEPEIIGNLLREIHYHFMESKTRSYDDNLPFINPYFSHVNLKKGITIPALNNGWVMGADTNENLVTTKNFYYLRRKIRVWGDLIRIRYGDDPKESPSWLHMREYVQTMAKYFNGFRLDNLHGTQMNVAQAMIKEARKVKPELIIFAELFTSTQKQKAVFVRTSGVNSTLFQLKHNLSGPQFLNLFYQSMGNHGKYAGSISPHFERPDGNRVKYCKRKKPIPLIYDLTHDNRTYEEEGQIIKKTPLAIITEYCGTFVGSTKGFDQFYSHKIIVTEVSPIYQRDEPKPIKSMTVTDWKKKILFLSTNSHNHVEIFGSWNNWQTGKIMELSGKIGFETTLELPRGLYQYKFKVNGQWTADPHKNLNDKGNHTFEIDFPPQKFIHRNLQMLRKKGAQSRQKFFQYDEYYAYCDGDIVILLREKKPTRESICVIINLSDQDQHFNNPVRLPGKIYKTDIWHQSNYSLYEGQTTDVQIINHSCLAQYFDSYFNYDLQKDILIANVLPPGFGCVIECKKTQEASEAIKSIEQMKSYEIKLPPLGPLDYNLIMYGVEPQEEARFNSTNFYLPSEKRKLIFGGFGGIIAELQKAKRYNLLSSGLFDSIRQGNWLLDYYIGRLKRFKHLTEFTDIVQRFFECLKRVPYYLRPKYFTDFIYKVYKKLQEQISNGSKNRFHRKLLLATTQFISSFQVNNPVFRVTLSAGLPHFSVGWARCWGRNTFMSNQLLLLYPNIYYDIILQFASTLRHGMIPNLLDFGNNPRYNSRDACWWFIRGAKQYARRTKDYTIYKAKVNMHFLSNDLFQHKQKVRRGEKKIMLVQEIIQNIFQSHVDGIVYREWNAGFELDANMPSDGFSIYLSVDQETGFISGGNVDNCLTWMDKMGSSGRAGNKGCPSTPRAGAPVQLTALLYHCLVEYDMLYKEGYYSFSGVKFDQSDISFENWANLIKDSFEERYWIDEKGTQKTKYENIYKDVIQCPQKFLYEEFRLRPNALVALALAPELLNPDHARKYLKVVEKQLIFEHSIGVSTLGQAHASLYVPYYDNNDDSNDFKVAHGFSYHNGPEWIWLYGFYVKAKCNFTRGLQKHQLNALLQSHARHLYSNDWGSLPELTNRNGQNNQFSCQSQAWSISSMLLAINSINQYQP